MEEPVIEKFQQLRRAVVKKSSRGPQGHYLSWDEAKQEWILIGEPIDYGEELGECVCGTPIRHGYCIRNMNTRVELILGSQCIKHFDRPDLQAMSHDAISGLRAIKTDRMQPASLALLRFLERDARIPRWITDRYKVVKKWKDGWDKDSWVFGINTLVLMVLQEKVPTRCHCGAVLTFTEGVDGLNWFIQCPTHGDIPGFSCTQIFLKVKRSRRKLESKVRI